MRQPRVLGPHKVPLKNFAEEGGGSGGEDADLNELADMSAGAGKDYCLVLRCTTKHIITAALGETFDQHLHRLAYFALVTF